MAARAALIAVLLVAGARGKGYKNGYRPPQREPASLSFNHSTVLLDEGALPAHFDW